jgi:ribonuclease J
MQEKLRDAGVEVISTEDYMVHASGHATPEQILSMYRLLKPKTVIPVHGDKRNIRKQRKLAAENGVGNVLVARNGEVILLKDGTSEVVSEVFTRKLGVDRKQLTPLDSQLVKNRKRIAYNCSVFISAFFANNWELKDLQISSIDILEENEWYILEQEILKEVTPLIEQKLQEQPHKTSLEDFIRGQIRRRILNKTDIKPVTFVHAHWEE